MCGALEDAAFDRLMDATQTLIQLKVGDVLTQEMIDDLHLVDEDHRESFERAVDAFHKGYEAGLLRGAGADTAKLIAERDEARDEAAISRALFRAASGMPLRENNEDCSRPKAGSPTAEGGGAQ
jgi:hypothetical protein